jgi:hypothetical protein
MERAHPRLGRTRVESIGPGHLMSRSCRSWTTPDQSSGGMGWPDLLSGRFKQCPLWPIDLRDESSVIQAGRAGRPYPPK